MSKPATKPTKAQIAAALREHMRQLAVRGGAKGGRARAANLSPEERSAAARRAVNARWAKQRAKTRKSKAR